VAVEVEDWVRFRGNESAELSDVDEPGAGPTSAAVQEGPREARQEREGPPTEQLVPVTEYAEALAKVRRLEVELARYRAHAERTSSLFRSVTKYAEWVRENARRDSELALRKARARVEKLDRTTSELERTESELARMQDELAHVQALTEETRARLSSFLTAGLQALNGKRDDEVDETSPARGDLQDTLQERLMSASPPMPAPVTEVEHPQR
jgi:vacuolar-type H+-ATPase subunit I/STV1